MSKMVTAIFDSVDYAEGAARQIKDQGLRTSDISIMAKNEERYGDRNTGFTMGRDNDSGANIVNDNISDGTITGSVLGSVAGLVLGFGLVTVPGLGIVAAAGPLAGIISGAVTGGIVGGLVDLGIPEEKSREYERHVKEGKVLFSMKTKDENVNRVTSILRDSGASEVQAF